jgi:hypothetical protein
MEIVEKQKPVKRKLQKVASHSVRVDDVHNVTLVHIVLL